MKRGYGQPHEKDSGGSDDDDMSDEGTDTDTLPRYVQGDTDHSACSRGCVDIKTKFAF